jgi:hypothetical protein
MKKILLIVALSLITFDANALFLMGGYGIASVSAPPSLTAEDRTTVFTTEDRTTIFTAE